MRFIPSREQVCENKPRPSRGEDGFTGGLGGGAMIGVVDIFITIKPSFRISGHNGIRLELSNESGEILAQRKRWFQLAIRVTQEEGLLNSKNFICVELFPLTQFRQFL